MMFRTRKRRATSRQSPRRSVPMLFSGIDLHKRSLVIHTLDADGATAREAELTSDRAAVMAYFGTLAGPHRAVVECVQSWYWLRDLLAPAGWISASRTPS